MAQKAGSVLLTSSIATYLISKEIYVIDGEFFEVLALFGAYYLWYSGAKDGVVEYFNERQNVSILFFLSPTSSFLLSCSLYQKKKTKKKQKLMEYNKKKTIRRVLNEAREQHKSVVKERIAHISKLDDVVDVTKALFSISKEIASLEAQAYELKQQVAFTSEVKSTLDAWVRYEASVREKEQRRMAEAVIAKVKAELADPRMVSFVLTFYL